VIKREDPTGILVNFCQSSLHSLNMSIPSITLVETITLVELVRAAVWGVVALDGAMDELICL